MKKENNFMTNFGLIGAAAIALLAATPAMAAQGRHHHRYAYARRAAPVRDPRQSWLDTVLQFLFLHFACRPSSSRVASALWARERP